MDQKVKWIFFDLGWTIVDEAPAHLERLQKTQSLLTGFGIPSSIDELESLVQRSAAEFVESPYRGMLSKLVITNDQRNKILEEARYNHSLEVLFPGVSELLMELKKNRNLGIIANQSRGAAKRLEALGILNHLSLVLSSTEVGLSKPDPRIFKHALEKAECQPGDAIMVGDRLDNDVSPAKKMGFGTIRVLQGYSRAQVPRDEFEKPDKTVNAIGDVLAVLEKV